MTRDITSTRKSIPPAVPPIIGAHFDRLVASSSLDAAPLPLPATPVCAGEGGGRGLKLEVALEADVGVDNDDAGVDVGDPAIVSEEKERVKVVSAGSTDFVANEGDTAPAEAAAGSHRAPFHGTQAKGGIGTSISEKLSLGLERSMWS